MDDLKELEETIFDEFEEKNLIQKQTPQNNERFDLDETRLPDDYEVEDSLDSDVESPSLLPYKQKKWKKKSLKVNHFSIFCKFLKLILKL